MKRTRILAILFAIVAAISCICACASASNDAPEYEITLNENKSFTVEVGDEIDYTQYFIVKDKNGKKIPVTESMLDLSRADTSKIGSFTVTLTLGNFSKKATFIVVPKKDDGITPAPDDPSNPTDPTDLTDPIDPSEPSDPSDPTDSTEPSEPDGLEELYIALTKYADVSTWNFAVNLTTTYGDETHEYYYEYLGYNVLNGYTVAGGKAYTDYLGYDPSDDIHYYYSDNGDGTYERYDEDTYEFGILRAYLSIIDLSELADFTFIADGDRYLAVAPNEAGNAVLGKRDGREWVNFAIYIENGLIAKIIGAMDDGYTEQYVFSKYGHIRFTLPRSGA